MSDDCLFCKLAAGKIAATKLHEDDRAIAFRDINPQAPVHFLVIPRRHIPTLADVAAPDGPLLTHLVSVANKVAQDQGLSRDGYRVVVNVGTHGGQTVFHLHLHVLGGRFLKWPPG